jgi:receptor protein-tyrosine kinase
LDEQGPVKLLPRRGGLEQGITPAEELYLVRREIDRLKQKEKLDLEELQRQRADFDRVFEAARTLAKEDEALKRAKELGNTIRSRLDQKTIERNVPGSISVLSKASVAQEPYRDRRAKLTLVALVGAFVAGAAMALIRARTNQSFHEVGELSQTRTPFLGQLPFVRDSEGLASENSPARVQAVRQLRTVLLERLPLQGGGVVLVTGASPKCGKSTVSLLLARSLAQYGKQVLLVDTDIRKPTLSEHFHLIQKEGLFGSLTGGTPESQAICPTRTPRLSVVPAGPFPNTADSELLADGAFEKLLDCWRSRYDVVLLDTAPVLPVADAAILSRHADGTVMVVREEHCRRGEVEDAFRDLVSSGANLLGTIFIGGDKRRRYARGYPDYYYAHAK